MKFIAVILVIVIFLPASIGYSAKPKMSSADSAAGLVFKATNTILAEFDEERIDVASDFTVTYSKDSGFSVGTVCTEISPEMKKRIEVTEDFANKMKLYVVDINKIDRAEIYISDGVCRGAMIAWGDVIGTYPNGVVTTDNRSELSVKNGGWAVAKKLFESRMEWKY